MTKKVPYIPHAGNILQNEFIDAMDNMDSVTLAKAIAVSPRHLDDIISGENAIDAETDAKLCQYFELSAEFFIRVQDTYQQRIVQYASQTHSLTA